MIREQIVLYLGGRARHIAAYVTRQVWASERLHYTPKDSVTQTAMSAEAVDLHPGDIAAILDGSNVHVRLDVPALDDLELAADQGPRDRGCAHRDRQAPLADGAHLGAANQRAALDVLYLDGADDL